MVPVTNPPSRRRLSPLFIVPRAQCIQQFPPSVPPPQKIHPGTAPEGSLAGRDEEVTSLQTSTPSGGPATFTSTSSTQKGEQAQPSAPPPTERPPESATIPQVPPPGIPPPGIPPPGIPPSFSDPLPNNDCNSTSTANPPIVTENGHGFKLPFLHSSDPGSNGETSTAYASLSTATTAASPSGSGKACPSFPGTDQLPKLEGTPAPSATSSQGHSATPPAQTTTTSSDGGGAVVVSPTVSRSTPITGMEAGASFPTGEVYSSSQPATPSRVIKSPFVYATLLVETTSPTWSTSPTGGVPVPTGSSHSGHSASVKPLIISLTTFTTYTVITTHGQVSSTPLTVTSVAAAPTTAPQVPNDPPTADATSSKATKSALTGGVVCAAIFLLAASLFVLFLVRRRRRRRTSSRRADIHAFPAFGSATLAPLSIPEKPGSMKEAAVVEGRSGHFNSISPEENSIPPRAVIPRTAERSSLLLLSSATFGSDSSHHSPRHTPNGSAASIQSTQELPDAHGHPYWGPVLQQARETLVSLGSPGPRPVDTVVSRASYSFDSVASSSSLPLLSVNVAERQVTPDPFADPEPNPFDDPTFPTKYMIVRPGTRLSLASGRMSLNSMSVKD